MSFNFKHVPLVIGTFAAIGAGYFIMEGSSEIRWPNAQTLSLRFILKDVPIISC